MSPELSRRDFVRTTAAAATGLAIGLKPTLTIKAGNPDNLDTSKILNYNPEMEYRRCGRTNLMVSAVCLGGHWKRLNTVLPHIFPGGNWLAAALDDPDFQKNRDEVVSRCIERGINYIDACTGEEVLAYARALRGRRDRMYLGYSWYQREVRFPEWRTLDKLKESLDRGLKEAGLDYVDIWRITCHEQSSRHSQAEIEAVIAALDWAKQTGRARFTGISSHDRLHIKMLLEQYPEHLDVICTPYTARTKIVTDETGLWATLQHCDVGWFGIKPFANASLFKGDSSPQSPSRDEDDRLARLALRFILCNPAITAPIPGMITPQQVDNAALAVKERRELDADEKAFLQREMDRVWASLPYHYRWLKDWEYV